MQETSIRSNYVYLNHIDKWGSTFDAGRPSRRAVDSQTRSLGWLSCEQKRREEVGLGLGTGQTRTNHSIDLLESSGPPVSGRVGSFDELEECPLERVDIQE